MDETSDSPFPTVPLSFHVSFQLSVTLLPRSISRHSLPSYFPSARLRYDNLLTHILPSISREIIYQKGIIISFYLFFAIPFFCARSLGKRQVTDTFLPLARTPLTPKTFENLLVFLRLCTPNVNTSKTLFHLQIFVESIFAKRENLKTFIKLSSHAKI